MSVHEVVELIVCLLRVPQASESRTDRLVILKRASARFALHCDPCKVTVRSKQVPCLRSCQSWTSCAHSDRLQYSRPVAGSSHAEHAGRNGRVGVSVRVQILTLFSKLSCVSLLLVVCSETFPGIKAVPLRGRCRGCFVTATCHCTARKNSAALQQTARSLLSAGWYRLLSRKCRLEDSWHASALFRGVCTSTSKLLCKVLLPQFNLGGALTALEVRSKMLEVSTAGKAWGGWRVTIRSSICDDYPIRICPGLKGC